MSFKVIENPDYGKPISYSGFKKSQFRALDGLFSRAASAKALCDRAVDVDFNEGICSMTFYRSAHSGPHLQFLVRQVGPQTRMYEIHKNQKGRIFKSGQFDKAFERMKDEVEALMPKPS